MADVTLSGLKFNISTSVTGTKSVTSLANSLKKLNEAVDRFNPQKLEGIKTSLESFNQLGKVKLDSNLPKKLKDLNEAIDGFSYPLKLQHITDSLKGLQNVRLSTSIAKELPKIAQSMDSVTQEQIEKVRDFSNAMQGLGALKGVDFRGLTKGVVRTAMASNPNAENDTDGATKKLSLFGSAIDSIKQKLASFGIGKSGVGKVGDEAEKSESKVKSLLKELLKLSFVKPIKSLGNSISEFGNKFSGLGKTIGRMALYRAVREGIKMITQGINEGLQNLYQYSKILGGEFASSMDRLASSSLYLKNSLGAMLSPLIDAIAPAIDFLIDKFVDLLNVVNEVFAALTGASTFTVAKRVSTEYAKAAGSAGSAAGSAKELKKTVLSFDELNQLKDNNSGGGGGGGGGGSSLDYSNMFEERGVSSFMENIKKMFEEARWEELGKTIGSEVNKALDNIPWDTVGQKLGFALNGVITTADSFLSEVNFFSIGEHFAELMNNAFAKFFDNPNQTESGMWHLGHLIGTKMLMLPSIIIGFIKDLDFGLVARSLSDGLIGYLNSFTDFFKGVNWVELGESLINGIVNFVKNINYTELAKSFFNMLFNGFKAGVELLIGAIKGVGNIFEELFDGENVKASLSVSLAKLDWKTVTDWVKKAVNFGKGVVKVLIELGLDVWNSVKEFLTGNNEGNTHVTGNVSLSAYGAFKDRYGSNLSKWITDNDNNNKVTAEVGLRAESGWQSKYGASLRNWITSNGTDRDVTSSVSLATGGSWRTVYGSRLSNWVTDNGRDSTVDVTVNLKKGAVDSGIGVVLQSMIYKANGGIITANGAFDFASGGSIYAHKINRYASGTAKAHGTVFIAGEAGSEIVGNVNGHTEVLNRSQIAQSIYSAVVNAMMTTINSMSYNYDSMDRLYSETSVQNGLLKEQNDILQQLLDKDISVDISSSDITDSINRRNRRIGSTVVAVG